MSEHPSYYLERMTVEISLGIPKSLSLTPMTPEISDLWDKMALEMALIPEGAQVAVVWDPHDIIVVLESDKVPL